MSSLYNLLITFLVVTIITSSTSALQQLNIQINPSQKLSPPIRSDFSSFSVEIPCAARFFSDDISTAKVRQSYVNLMKFLKNTSNGDLGPNIRIGGNSADQTIYAGKYSSSSSTSLPPGDKNIVKDEDIYTYNIAKLWNGTVTINLNLRNQTEPTNAVDYAVASTKIIRDPTTTIDTFEIGNEPDLFQFNGIRKTLSYNYSDYENQFEMYQNAMTKAGVFANQPAWIQGAVFSNAAPIWLWDFFIPQYISKFSKNRGTVSRTLRTISHHQYPLWSKLATIPQLMEPWSVDLEIFRKNAALANEAGSIFTMGECNSAFNGGAWNVSNTFASTLWALDFMLNAVDVGFRRVNFHGCDGEGSSYTPIATRQFSSKSSSSYAYPRPLYYAMVAFSFAARDGATLLSSSSSSSSSKTSEAEKYFGVRFHALASSKMIRAIAIHKSVKDSAEAVNVTFNVMMGSVKKNNVSSSARVYRLEVSKNSSSNKTPMQILSSTNGVYFANQTFDGSTNGLPFGERSYDELVPVSASGEISVVLNPASAIIVEVDIVL